MENNQLKQNKEWEEEFDSYFIEEFKEKYPKTVEAIRELITKTIKERDDWWIQQIARMKREGIDLQVLINHLKD